MADVLNRDLYKRLRLQYHRVQIKHPGEAMIARPIKGIEDEPLLQFQHTGEYYAVCCPYCRDTKFRLYVNHMYGQRDGHGRRMLFLAHCYNEGCMENPENRLDFQTAIDDLGLSEAEISEGVVVPEEAREVLPPGPCTSLAELEQTHEAVAYVTARQFSPEVLSRAYGISYCTSSQYSLARRRIIIPVTEGGKLKGWQARYPGELKWKGPDKTEIPKYWSCPGSDFRSKCVYNLDRMKAWKTGVIVEGPTDVWRFGEMSGCVFGNSVTAIQQKKLLRVFRDDRTLVLLLDPEEFESRTSVSLCETLTGKMPGRFCAVKLPEGTDPGSLDREFLRAYVKEEAARQGVKVSYRRVRP